jgi:4,5-DOPA dioxygenase extradiol
MGCPSELSAATYPAPGSPRLTERIQRLDPEITLDHGWELDHGCWSVVRPMWPDASIPVLQLCLDRGRSPARHLALAS